MAGELVATAGVHVLDRVNGVATIGLNVAPDNQAARRLYQQLGFVEVLAFEEAELTPCDPRPLVPPLSGD